MASLDRVTEAEEYIPTAAPGFYRPSTTLPISAHRRALLYAVSTFPITILIGETGSGKTTQLPQFLHSGGFTVDGKIVACTQPRRVAATTVAIRVAEEMGVRVGDEVGYSIRFEDMTGPKTRIKYMTDGMLLREALIDPLLSRYSVVMVDEAHERSLSTDVLLGVLKKIRKKRKDLRLVVSSATLQAEEFLRFFTDGEEEEGVATIVGIEGRCYPVDCLYLEEPTEDYVEKAVQTVFDIHLKEGEGDILVFLTGREEIEHAARTIAERSSDLHPRAPQLLPLPLYAGLPSDAQLAIFDPAPETHRKVILSTNIAEASITIDGIAFVVDTGFVKIRAYNPHTGIETLTAVPISKAAATQRAGRAGRTRPGKCFRLYTEKVFTDVLAAASIPEVQRSNLAPTILQLKALGIDNVARFGFVTPPPSELMARALELLYSLGALDTYARLTKPLGTRMAELPVDPQLSRILLASVDAGCHAQILSIAAMTTVQNIFITHSDSKQAESKKRLFSVEQGDHLTLLNVFVAFTKHKQSAAAAWCRDNYLNYKVLVRAASVRSQLWRYLARFFPDLETRTCDAATEVTIRKCLIAGYFAHAARMRPDGTYAVAGAPEGAEPLWVHPSSVLFNRKAEWVVFHEVVETGRKTFIRDLTCVEKGWLVEGAPEYYRVKGGTR